MAAKHALDRSTMFTCLLDLSPKYGQLTTKAGERIVTEALAAWYDSTATNMYVWAKNWIKENRPELLPFRDGAR